MFLVFLQYFATKRMTSYAWNLDKKLFNFLLRTYVVHTYTHRSTYVCLKVPGSSLEKFIDSIEYYRQKTQSHSQLRKTHPKIQSRREPSDSIFVCPMSTKIACNASIGTHELDYREGAKMSRRVTGTLPSDQTRIF